ncbi:MAG: hypothetical protein NTX85_02915 [Candidatus Nomurabacteria bacterium]|nr:hypothetical protein [Candidatus Nomurabacteria bacterium]
MVTYKVKYKNYIADLYIPNIKSGKIVLLLPGLPKSSNVEKIINTFLSCGCFVIYPNFSGTFDSGGFFSGEQSVKDVKNFIKLAKLENVTELYFGKKINLGLKNKIILSGMSFGSNIALLGCDDSVDKLILLSPVLLFNKKDINKIISFDFHSQMRSLISLLKKAYPYTYRINQSRKVEDFIYGKNIFQSESNIKNHLNNLKLPTLIIHGKIDNSVPWDISYSLKKSINNNNISWEFPRVGHSLSSYDENTTNLITKFI